MAFKEVTDSFNKVAERLEDYTASMAEYYKLRLFKSSMKGAISLVNLLVFGGIFLFVLLFLSVGASFWLGTFFDQPYIGFFLVGGFYGIILIFMFIYGRKIIERNLLHKFSAVLYEEGDRSPKKVAEDEIEEFEEFTHEEKKNAEIM